MVMSMSSVRNSFCALALWLMSVMPVMADSIPAHWNVSSGASADGNFLLPDYDPGTPNARKLTEDTTDFLKFTDGGPGQTFKLEFDTAPLPILRGGTGGATQQAAINSLLGYAGLASQDVIFYDGTNWSIKHKGANGTVLGIDGSGNLAYISPAGSGTVTSVDMTVPSWLTVGGNPVTGSGTLAVTATSGLAANSMLATPDGATGALSVRAMVPADVPNLPASKITSGNLAKAQHSTDAVFDDQSNVYTGTFTQDFSASGQTLRVPLKTDPGTPVNGEIWINAGAVKMRDGSGATQVMVPQARTITAGTGLTGGGDLSANRTLTAANTATTGYTAQTSYATGDTLYASAANTLAKRTIGATGQVYTVAGGIPTWAAPPTGFGGGGADGAMTVTTSSYTAPIQKNATTYSVTAANTLTINGSPCIINCTSTFTNNGTITVAAGSGYAGGTSTANLSTAASGTNGSGPGGGHGMVRSSNGPQGGGGGGFGGAGGNPDISGATATVGGGRTYATDLIGGSGGGGADFTTAGSQAAGAGGGSLIVCAVGAISIPSGGVINCKGSAAVAATNGGGCGGGAGGMVFLASQASISHATGSTIDVSGGAGAALVTTGGNGGGGGGGRLYRWTQGTITATGTFTATGGAAGGGAATAGGAGVATSIVGTPNMPLLTWTFDQGGLNEIESIRATTIAFKELRGEPVNPFDVAIDGREVIRRAAGKDLNKFALYTNPQPMDQAVNTVLCVGDHIEVLKDAA